MGGSRRVPLPKTSSRSKPKKVAARGAATKAKARKAAALGKRLKAKTRKIAARSRAAAKAADATYVYCVVRDAQQPVVANQLEALPGLGAAAGAARVLELTADTWLVVATVPLKMFGEDALRKRMRDVNWVSRCGVAHQAVIDSFLTADAVVPMTLFTIFANDARALAEARKDAARLEASLDRVTGRAEWVVRVLRGDGTPASGTVTSSTAANGTTAIGLSPSGVAAAAAAPRSGREFLQAKVDQRQAARRAAEETEQAVRALMTGLSDVADDANDRTEAVTAGALRSAALLDAAFLVTRTAEPRFEEAARRLGQPLLDRGFKVSVTGPWPCYSFVSSRSSS